MRVLLLGTQNPLKVGDKSSEGDLTAPEKEHQMTEEQIQNMINSAIVSAVQASKQAQVEAAKPIVLQAPQAPQVQQPQQQYQQCATGVGPVAPSNILSAFTKSREDDRDRALAVGVGAVVVGVGAGVTAHYALGLSEAQSLGVAMATGVATGVVINHYAYRKP